MNGRAGSGDYGAMTYTPIQVQTKGAARMLSLASYASMVVVAVVALTGGCGAHGARPDAATPASGAASVSAAPSR